MIRSARIAMAGAAVALLAGLVAAPASAADAYNATVAGQRGFTPLVNLVQSSTLTVDVANLPAGVGLYALHCKVPTDPRSAPTVCDQSTGAANYLPASDAARPTASLPIKVNAEFWGTNPNPTTGVVTGESVDCRADTGNPRATTCAVYVLGAGKESANPAYLRIFPTVFKPLTAQRSNDVVTITLDGNVVKRGTTPKLGVNDTVPFVVALKSGLTPSVSADNCTIDTKTGTITALKSQGTCIVRITSTGGNVYKPLVKTQVFRLTK
jgi:hypothetical protein